MPLSSAQTHLFNTGYAGLRHSPSRTCYGADRVRIRVLELQPAVALELAFPEFTLAAVKEFRRGESIRLQRPALALLDAIS